jgi:hypothetical protein
MEVLGDLRERLPARGAADGGAHHLVGGLPWGSAGNPLAFELVYDRCAVQPHLLGEDVDGGAGLVLGDEVVDLVVGEASLDRVRKPSPLLGGAARGARSRAGIGRSGLIFELAGALRPLFCKGSDRSRKV